VDKAQCLSFDVENEVKCLGIWWTSDSLCCKSIDERCFAHGDLGAFHGLLNPLPSRSLVEACVISVLMYGAKFWSLNSILFSKLESFQAQLGKRILKLPKYTANNIPLLALQWPSMRCCCLCKTCLPTQSGIS